jgi:nitroreductase
MQTEKCKECMGAIKDRRSIRRFKETPLGMDIIDQLLSLAQMAPSAGNLQSRDFVVVTDNTTKKKLTVASLDQSFIEQAPVVIVFVANIERASRRYGSRGELYAIQDATASVMTLLIAAQSMGISSCWVGAFDDFAVSEILCIPYGTKPVAIVPLGMADETPATPNSSTKKPGDQSSTWSIQLIFPGRYSSGTFPFFNDSIISITDFTTDIRFISVVLISKTLSLDSTDSTRITSSASASEFSFTFS